ncbi:MAG: hypothetical protein ACYCYI_09190 [Saccharofermentanales bacterium]
MTMLIFLLSLAGFIAIDIFIGSMIYNYFSTLKLGFFLNMTVGPMLLVPIVVVELYLLYAIVVKL